MKFAYLVVVSHDGGLCYYIWTGVMGKISIIPYAILNYTGKAKGNHTITDAMFNHEVQYQEAGTNVGECTIFQFMSIVQRATSREFR